MLACAAIYFKLYTARASGSMDDHNLQVRRAAAWPIRMQYTGNILLDQLNLVETKSP